jgi:hypothetical protein
MAGSVVISDDIAETCAGPAVAAFRRAVAA